MKIKTITSSCLLAISCQFLMYNAKAQNEYTAKEIEARSNVWNSSFNNRDSTTLYTLFDSTAVLSSAAGHFSGLEACTNLFRALFSKRPDITWYNQKTTIEIYDHWRVAYETGDWIESWTESGDTSKSTIKGKYWIMWRLKKGNWIIISATFTPLSCTGSYCK
jgi:ketosteroid isomerase-like protein